MSLHELPFAGRVDLAVQIGSAAEVIAYNSEYRKFQFAALEFWLIPAALHGQVKCFFDATGRPTGFITWALVNAHTEQKLINDHKYILHPSEWIEGDHLIVMDACTNNGHFRAMLRLLKQQFTGGLLWPGVKSIRAIRREKSGELRKVVTWFELKSGSDNKPAKGGI
ncbi:toxin-activating lysine-acyltransferase [Iodobacter sp. HSC-16F04]|uniref:RTX toxin-activating lysine-acyltransferase n=1 Tax=Iodobacter violaceini TaxID=3044271 RepID=A0ABX0KTV0_9NEIS|nr:toxin-activating lysine-acyltransferase [Iodobacter violacea]NHQ85785.1 toxin-activating lysine-acyltransferase [Iodobacter violacea]